ncbi:MAG TPA: hypothetical protein VGK20_09270 [Candidatus Binatia bacterium]
MPQGAGRTEVAWSRASDFRLIAGASLVNASVALAVLAVFGIESPGIELALRITARVSMLWFLLAYLAWPVSVLGPEALGRRLLAKRRAFGIIFGISMSMHVAFILRMFALYIPERPPMVQTADFTIGIPGLMLVAAMTLTSFDALKKAVGPQRWGQLHRVGLHFVWAVFFLCLTDSVGRKQAVSPLLEYGFFIAMLLAAATLRFVAWRRFARVAGRW